MFLDGQRSGEPNVFVNNMNTQHANLGIPEKNKAYRRQLLIKQLALPDRVNRLDNDVDRNLFTSADAAMRSGVGTESGRIGVDAACRASSRQRSGWDMRSSTASGKRLNDDAASSERQTDHLSHGGPLCVTPRLERAYQRIMRRLQRQLNLQSLVAIPLATQFDIAESDVLDLKEMDDGPPVYPATRRSSSVHLHSPGAPNASLAPLQQSTESTTARSLASSPSPTDAHTHQGRAKPLARTHSRSSSSSSASNISRGSNHVQLQSNHVAHHGRGAASNRGEEKSRSGHRGGLANTTLLPPRMVSKASSISAQLQQQRQQTSHEQHTRSDSEGARSCQSMRLSMHTDGWWSVMGAAVEDMQPGPPDHASPARYEGHVRGDADDGEDDSILAEQVCPATLRLVVQHVRATLQRKMILAEWGSMRDCLCAVFECRALLDRMLKEMPNYLHFRESVLQVKETAYPSGAAATRAETTDKHELAQIHTRLQQCYRTFRKQPVVLPPAHYVEDSTTGAVRAQLDVAQVVAVHNESCSRTRASNESMSGGVTCGVHEQTSIASRSSSNRNSPSSPSSHDEGTEVDGEAAMRPAEPRAAGANHEGTLGNGSERASPAPPPFSCRAHSPALVAASLSGPRPVGSMNRHTHTASLAGGAHSRGRSSAPVATLPPTCGLSSRLVGRGGAATSSMDHTRRTPLRALPGAAVMPDALHGDSRAESAVTGPEGRRPCSTRSGHRVAVSAAVGTTGGRDAAVRETCWATQRCDVGTLTEVNAVTTVPREVYEAMRAHAQQLSAQLYEAQQAREGVVEELHAEQSAVARGSRVVRYLRHTLVRECNTLRTQLHCAALQQQQNMHSTSHLAMAPTSSFHNGAPPRRVWHSAARGSDTSSTLPSVRATTLSARPNHRVTTSTSPTATTTNSPSHGDAKRTWTSGGATSYASATPPAALGDRPAAAQAVMNGGRGGHIQPVVSQTHRSTVTPTLSGPVRFVQSTAGGGHTAAEGGKALTVWSHATGSGYGSGTRGGEYGHSTVTATDMTAIQSLLDLVLLTVEKEGSLPLEMALEPTWALQATRRCEHVTADEDRSDRLESGWGDARDSSAAHTSPHRPHDTSLTDEDSLRQCDKSNSHGDDTALHDRASALARRRGGAAAAAEPLSSEWAVSSRQQVKQLRIDFASKQRALKDAMVEMRVHLNHVIHAKEEEVNRLRRLTDTNYIQTFLNAEVQTLRLDCRKLRNYAQEQMHAFQAHFFNAMHSLRMRTQVADRAVAENTALMNTQQALKDLIHNACDLLRPMVTPEYARGYHPWALKTRNRSDPLVHTLQLHHGRAESVRLREELSAISELYLATHAYVVGQVVVPKMDSPAVGQALREVCAALCLAAASSSELVFAVRQHYVEESRLCAQLAQLNARILWNAYLQRAYVERSIGALIDAGLDYNTTGLPVSTRINELAMQRETMLCNRVSLQRARAENAKDVYALWKEAQVNIFAYYPLPMQHNPLSLQASPQDGNSSLMAMSEMGPRGAVLRALNAIYKTISSTSPMTSLSLLPTAARTSLSQKRSTLCYTLVTLASCRSRSHVSDVDNGAHGGESNWRGEPAQCEDGPKEGYGPFSTAAKARKMREQRDVQRVPNVMNHMQLANNINLRLSLSALTHPTQLSDSVSYKSPQWSLTMVRLYRAILRLHNKTVAVPRPAAAATAVRKGVLEDEAAAVTNAAGSPACDTMSPDLGRLDADDKVQLCQDTSSYYLRYLLTEEQRTFGTHFVRREFANHVDADAFTAGNFYAGWYSYVLQLASGVTARELTEDEKRLLAEDQQERLHHLHSACISLAKSIGETT